MLKKKDTYILAVAGATGAVGREILELLEERNFPVDHLTAFASEDSEGERLEFRGRNAVVRSLAKDAFRDVDIAFFSGGAEQSRAFAGKAAESGAVVIDSSGAFSLQQGVPLVIPEINSGLLEKHRGIIANPVDSAIALAMILKPIRDAMKVKRVVVTTFQSVTGSGKEAMDELAQQTVSLLNFRDVETRVYPHQIAFNCIPQVDAFIENGATREESLIAAETRKIFDDDSLKISVTCARVPVFRGNSASINIETEQAATANELRAILAGMPGLMVYDDPMKNLYPLAIDVVGKDEVYVGRIREDQSISNGSNLWVAYDNLRKGAALNAVQIAEKLVS